MYCDISLSRFWFNSSGKYCTKQKCTQWKKAWKLIKVSGTIIPTLEFIYLFQILVGGCTFSVTDSFGEGHKKSQRNSRWCQEWNCLMNCNNEKLQELSTRCSVFMTNHISAFCWLYHVLYLYLFHTVSILPNRKSTNKQACKITYVQFLSAKHGSQQL